MAKKWRLRLGKHLQGFSKGEVYDCVASTFEDTGEVARVIGEGALMVNDRGQLQLVADFKEHFINHLHIDDDKFLDNYLRKQGLSRDSLYKKLPGAEGYINPKWGSGYNKPDYFRFIGGNRVAAVFIRDGSELHVPVDQLNLHKIFKILTPMENI